MHMSDDLEKGIGRALSGALANVLLGGENRTERAYLSLMRIGYPINDQFLEFLSATPFRFYGGTGAGEQPTDPQALRAWNERQAKNNALQQMAKNAAAFASLVDAIPGAVGDWMRTDKTLDEFYKNIWLTFIDVPNPALSPATLAAYDKARKILGYNDAADELAIGQLETKASELDDQAAKESDVLKQLAYQDTAEKLRTKIQAILDKSKTLYAAYATQRNKYQKAIADLNLQLNTDSSDDFKIRTLRDAVKNALDEWQVVGNKAQYEQAMATVARVDSTDLSKTVEGLKRRFDSVQLLNDAAGQPFVPVGLIPANFHKQRDSWTSVGLTDQKLRDTSSYDHTVTSSGTGPGIFWSGGSSTSDTTNRIVTDASQKLTVNFEVARVVIDRSTWFDANLLTSRMWKWADNTPEPRLLADGKIPSDSASDLMLPMYATEVIVARNVRVSLAMTESESTSFHSEVTRSSHSGFWVFGSSSTETRTEDRSSYTWSAGTGTLQMPGMQIIGFVCDCLPKLPNPSF
jgi:hypothetical protein